MNFQPPIDQNVISIYSGNAQIIKARLEQFLNARPMLRIWTLPNYARLSGFPEYEAQMKLIFHDAQIYDVVMGRALRTVPNPAEPALVTNGRRIYDEANFQAYSLIVRTFTTANSGFVDAGGSLENDGHLLWTKLVRFNHGTSADGISYLKAAFYDHRNFIQKEDVSLDHWAAEVRQASSILALNGHPISEADKSLAFRHGLSRADLQTALILPARRENFEDLVITARAFVLATAGTPKPSLQAVDDAAYCTRCFTEHGRRLRHALADCLRSNKTEAAAGSGKRDACAQDVECFCCHLRGHYADACPTPHLSRARPAKRARGRRTRHSPVDY
jgi:hypothetical protein